MYVFFLILISIFEIVLGIIVLRKNRNRANVAFAAVVLLAFLWSIVNYLADNPIDPSLALLWNRLTFTVAFLQGAFLFYFASFFPFGFRKLERISEYALLPLGCILAALSAFTNLIVDRVEFLDWGTNVEPGALYGSFIGFMSVSVIGMLVILILKYRRSVGLEKYQLKYLFFGFLLTAVIALTTNLFLPLVTGNNELARFGPLSMAFLIGFTVYAIVKHRLMDIRIVLRKIVLHLLISATLLVFILGAIFTVAHFYSKRIPDLSLVFTGSFSMVVALLFLNPLYRFFERIANKYFFTSLYNYQETLEGLANGLTGMIDYQKVIGLIVDTIMKTMGLDRVGVLLLSSDRNGKHYTIAKTIGFNEKNGISLVRDNFLVHWLIRYREPVVYDELGQIIEEKADRFEKGRLMKLRTSMQRIEASLCVPIFSKDVLLGIIVLGNKVTKDAYTVEDLRLLTTISNQASVAIDNALHYRQVQDLNENLQKQVKEQTADITRKNEQLEELLKMKSEFLSIASHQLRTPLTAIRGLLSMQAEGDFDTFPQAELKKQQKNMLDSANRLANIVNDLLNAMEFEGGERKIELKPTDLKAVVEEICKELKPNYDKKGLTLTVKAPEKPLPLVTVEAKMFREAIENLIDNAEKYTNKGGTTVTLSQKGKSAVIEVKDTGIGIPKSDLPRLFQKFSRGEKSTYQHTDGSGLGLFIAKNVIRSHHGSIDLKSEEGKGTTFTVTIPLTPQPQTQAVVQSQREKQPA